MFCREQRHKYMICFPFTPSRFSAAVQIAIGELNFPACSGIIIRLQVFGANIQDLEEQYHQKLISGLEYVIKVFCICCILQVLLKFFNIFQRMVGFDNAWCGAEYSLE